MALDLLLLNQLQRLNRNAGYNEFFPRRPVCAYYSAVNASYNFMIDFYAEYATIPMRTFYTNTLTWGAPASFLIASNTESNQTYYWAGVSNAQASTNSVNPNGGMVGITGHAQTRCLNNVDLNSEQFFAGTYSTPANLERSCGVILGEGPSYRQGLNLYKNGGNIYISYIGDNNTLSFNPGVSLGDKAFAWTALTGLNRLSGAQAAGMGDIGYNRKTNTLAFMEGVNDSTGSYRIHIFKNLPKLRASAEHLRLALTAAIAGGVTTYETFDFQWQNANDTEWHLRTRVIPCDDGTFWLVRCGTGSVGVFLLRLYFSSGTTRASEGVRAVASSNMYSSVNGAYYGIRHMVSDDNTMVACYCQYYYYLAGACVVFVPRSSAADKTRHAWMQITDTASGYSIAPSGGPNFVMGVNSNADSRTQDGFQTAFDNPASLNNTQLTFITGFYNISGYSQSTSYGGTGFVKVQDPLQLTTEWRERLLAA